MKKEKWKGIYTYLLTIFIVLGVLVAFQKHALSSPKLKGKEIAEGGIRRYVDNESGVVCYLYTNITSGNSMVCLQPSSALH